VGVGDDDRSFYIITVVCLMTTLLFLLPIMAWMFIDIKIMEIRVNKALAKIESK